MSKVVNQTNWRVEAIVEPLRGYADSPKNMRWAAEELQDEIRRHCDAASVSIAWDTITTCSLCGSSWELDDDGVPCCCDAAIEEYEIACRNPQT